MRPAHECERRAEQLEKLAQDESDEIRRNAYRQMAAYWRQSARLRPQPAE